MATQTNLPAVVNYTSRDFYSLRDDLITRVQARVNANGKQWNATDPADFGLALVEAMAHVGDLNSHYIDRAANESFLATAIQRQSILNIANMYGYIPAGYRQSTVDVTFSNPTESELIIPVGTLFSVDVIDNSTTSQTVAQILFTLTSDTVIAAAVDGVSGTATGTLTHGQDVTSLAENAADPGLAGDIAGELVGTSSGLSNQTFQLSHNQVVDNSVTVYVKNGDTYNEWRKVDNLSDFLPTDPVYTLTTDGNNYVYINFGDGISGAIPSLDEPIKADYIVGGGLTGNIEGGYVFNLLSTPATSGVTVLSLGDVTAANDDAATGGEDPESNDSIRANAPKALRALNRAVTVSDYANLSLYVSHVGKAAAYATSPNSVNLYVGPQVSDVSQDYFPGYDATNTTVLQSWYDLSSSVTAYLSDKSQIGTTVSVLPPTYVPVTVTIQYIKSEQYSDDSIIAAIKYALIYGYGYNFLDFNKVIYPENIERDLSYIDGILSVKVTELYRTGGSPSRSTIKSGDGEYLVFASNELAVYPAAGLSAFSSSQGTLTPPFSPSIFAYSIAGVSTSSLTVTPTAANASATIKVNGTVVTSGTASGSISTPTGTTTITTSILSADETTSNEYVFKVTR